MRRQSGGLEGQNFTVVAKSAESDQDSEQRGEGKQLNEHRHELQKGESRDAPCAEPAVDDQIRIAEKALRPDDDREAGEREQCGRQQFPDQRPIENRAGTGRGGQSALLAFVRRRVGAPRRGPLTDSLASRNLDENGTMPSRTTGRYARAARGARATAVLEGGG